ncbi:hypothetical protein [Sedimenticola hydrogenitrophicus]|uniref:hypothetical protein n=1 Tax=Sedimenticola hydrogenitrophicus TaxID=2967975 RepID=UPI0023AFCF35|nr:hypothetical protein [Sedimenticola hydrogenitrophicus]
MSNEELIIFRERASHLTPILEKRYQHLVELLLALCEGERDWDVDIELALEDVKSAAELLIPIREEESF